MMLDWNDYQKQVLATVAELGRSTPGTVRGYRELSNAGAALIFSTRVLDAYAAKSEATATSAEQHDG